MGGSATIEIPGRVCRTQNVTEQGAVASLKMLPAGAAQAASPGAKMRRRITLATRRELTAEVSRRYRESDRVSWKLILDEFTKITGYHRKHAIRLLTAPSAPRGNARVVLSTRRQFERRWSCSGKRRIGFAGSEATQEFSDGGQVGTHSSSSARALTAATGICGSRIAHLI